MLSVFYQVVRITWRRPHRRKNLYSPICSTYNVSQAPKSLNPKLRSVQPRLYREAACMSRSAPCAMSTLVCTLCSVNTTPSVTSIQYNNAVMKPTDWQTLGTSISIVRIACIRQCSLIMRGVGYFASHNIDTIRVQVADLHQHIVNTNICETNTSADRHTADNVVGVWVYLCDAGSPVRWLVSTAGARWSRCN